LDVDSPFCSGYRSAAFAGTSDVSAPKKRETPAHWPGSHIFGMMSEKLAVAVVETARATAAVLTRTQPAATAATTVTVRAGGFSGNRANGKRAKTDGNATADAATTATTAATATEAANAAVTESPATATEATRTTTTEPTATATLCKLNALASRLTTDLRQRERAARRCHRCRRRHPHLSGVRRRRNEADGPGCNRNHF
jgi:hypothetical protein